MIAVTMGFSLTMGETDAVPISCSWAAWLIGEDPVGGKRRAWQLLRQLEAREVIRVDGCLQPFRGRRDGTRCWQPYDYDLAALWVPECEQRLRVVGAEQEVAA